MAAGVDETCAMLMPPRARGIAIEAKNTFMWVLSTKILTLSRSKVAGNSACPGALLTFPRDEFRLYASIKRRKNQMRRRTAVFVASIIMLAVLKVGHMQAQNEKKEAPPPPPDPKVKVGDTFPDFTLIDQNRNKVSLHDFKGKKNVAVAFVVFAFTGG